MVHVLSVKKGALTICLFLKFKQTSKHLKLSNKSVVSVVFILLSEISYVMIVCETFKCFLNTRFKARSNVVAFNTLFKIKIQIEWPILSLNLLKIMNMNGT